MYFLYIDYLSVKMRRVKMLLAMRHLFCGENFEIGVYCIYAHPTVRLLFLRFTPSYELCETACKMIRLI
jgi:hypothetical protein